MQRLYSIRSEEKDFETTTVALLPVADVNFDVQMKIVKKYWQNHALAGRRRVLSDGTINSTRNCMYALKNGMGRIEFSDEWVSVAIEMMRNNNMPNGSINTYLGAIRRFFEANGYPIIVPVFKPEDKEHFFYSIPEVNQLIASTRSIPHRAIVAFLYY